MSEHFSPDEFRCTCWRCVNNPAPVMAPRLYDVLEGIRARAGVPIYVTSGYRCVAHNAEVNGVPGSYHTKCVAADITADGISVEELAQMAEAAGADGVGRYYGRGFVHVDVRGYAARWEQDD